MRHLWHFWEVLPHRCTVKLVTLLHTLSPFDLFWTPFLTPFGPLFDLWLTSLASWIRLFADHLFGTPVDHLEHLGTPFWHFGTPPPLLTLLLGHPFGPTFGFGWPSFWLTLWLADTPFLAWLTPFDPPWDTLLAGLGHPLADLLAASDPFWTLLGTLWLTSWDPFLAWLTSWDPPWDPPADRFYPSSGGLKKRWKFRFSVPKWPPADMFAGVDLMNVCCIFDHGFVLFSAQPL